MKKEKSEDKNDNEANESTERKNNRKKSKVAQNKKKKNKKNKKTDYEPKMDEDDDYILNQILEYESQNKEPKKKDKAVYFYETDPKKIKNQVNLPKNKVGFGNKDNSKAFDLNDLDFLNELGEELSKTDKNYGHGRKNNFWK